MKRIFICLLTAALLCSAAGCSSKKEGSGQSSAGDGASLTSSGLASGDGTLTSQTESRSSPEKTSSQKTESAASKKPASSKTSSVKKEDNMGKTYTNPVAQRADDPWVIRQGGSYYYCYSGNGGVCVKKLDRLTDLSRDGGVTVWTPPSGREYSKELWAPELHYLNGRWYIYVAADDGKNENHRMYCLEGDSSDPTKPFAMKGKVADKSDRWAIDGTVMNLSGRLYFIWSGWEGSENVAQNIYIASMSNPWTLNSDRVMLSKPEFYFELNGAPKINEGPAVLQRDGKTFVAYSGSGSWTDDYCLGLLTFQGGDPLKAANWEKATDPVFLRTDKVFGPGHCSFTVSPDGREDWMIYHANEVSGSGWGGRKGCIQKVEWKNGKPDFGRPLAFGTPAPVPSGE